MRNFPKDRESADQSIWYGYILPVLFYEYLALSLARSLIPGMMVEKFGLYSYAVVGIMEAVRGFLAFIACPLFGKLSDRIGRKFCLMASVIGMDVVYGSVIASFYIFIMGDFFIGTTLPTCSLFFTGNMVIFVGMFYWFPDMSSLDI